jgi:cytochrome c oxidase subunit 1
MDLWIFGVALATAGELALAVCVLATVLGPRAPGMTLLRLPVFSWTMVATTLMVCFAFPVLIVALVLLWLQRQYGGIFVGEDGAVTWQHLFWFYGHPVVYVMFFPFVGAVAEAFATFSGRRFFGYRLFVGSILLFAALSMSVWGHHMFTTGAVDNKYFSLTTTAILVPAGVEYFDLLGTLWGGRIRFTAALLFGVTFLLQFLVGGLTGIWVAAAPLDYHANNSYFVVAHFHYTLFAGSVFALFCGIYYWFPRWTGALLREGLGKLQLALMVVGTNLTFAPMFALGHEGMTRRVADYPRHAGWETLNTLATIGAFLIALGVVVFLVNLAVSLRARDEAGPDPWGGQTLEWSTGPPPPVRSYAPLWDLRHGEA